jgi:hypothetical protein
VVSRLLLLGLVSVLSAALLLNGPLGPKAADAAPTVSNLAFSSGMTDDFRPVDQRIEFGSDNDGVFVTFDFQDLPKNSGMTRIVRVNHADYNWDNDVYGHMKCCPDGGSGRYGFRVVTRSGNVGELPGGAYEVRLYLDSNEIASGGFGIRGDNGRDFGGNNNGSNGND